MNRTSGGSWCGVGRAAGVAVLRPALVLGLAAAVLALAGCLAGSSVKQTRSGSYVAETTFDQIEPGKTTAAWLKATLGEPSEKVKADATEVWKWKYKERTESNGGLFLIFYSSSDMETDGTAFVELKDEVVVRKWRG